MKISETFAFHLPTVGLACSDGWAIALPVTVLGVQKKLKAGKCRSMSDVLFYDAESRSTQAFGQCQAVDIRLAIHRNRWFVVN